MVFVTGAVGWRAHCISMVSCEEQRDAACPRVHGHSTVTLLARFLGLCLRPLATLI